VNNKLYVGNLPFSATEAEITKVFGGVGTVIRAKGRRAQVRPDCRFVLKLRRARRARLRFSGNEVLRRATRRVRVRY
jgi:RNA recognition motif-containing protein